MEIKNVIIILTPFQMKMIYKIFSNLFDKKDTLIFHSKYVTIEKEDCELVEINNFQFSRKKLFKLDMTYFKETRLAISEIRDEIKGLIDKFKFSENLDVYFGSEKDIFTQMFLQTAYFSTRISNLIAIEEGIGYYKTSPGFKTTILKGIYKIATPILFKERLEYVHTLGVDPRITQVYARLPHLLPLKRKWVKYKKIQEPNIQLNRRTSVRLDKILIYSFPSIDSGMSDEDKTLIFNKLITIFSDKDIYIKPHPREEIAFFDELKKTSKFYLMKKSLVGEEINYFEFEKIVNFASSVVLDIIMSGYPSKNIYTIFINKPLSISFFNVTNCLKPLELNKQSLEA